MFERIFIFIKVEICYLTITHKEKQKVCKFFIVPRGGRAMLGMSNIETLGVLTINQDTTGRQLASDDNTDKIKTSGQSKKAVQTESRETESCKNKMQDANVQKQCNANNIAKPSVDTNPMVMGNNNNSNKSFLSQQIAEDNMKTNVKQTNQKNKKDDNGSFHSDQYKKNGMEAFIKQMEKKKTKQKKK